MANGGQVNFFLDAVDDPLLPDSVPTFDGGQFSNLRANLLQPNQSAMLFNCDVDKLGKVRTRRGTSVLGTGPPSGVANTIIQGLTSYQTPGSNYVVAANNAKIWKFVRSGSDEFLGAWTQIATGGVRDNAEMLIYREGKINQPTVTTALPRGGYSAGATVLEVKEVGYVGTTAPPANGGIIGIGEKLYFSNNLRTDWYEYTVAVVFGGPPVTRITLEEPLVFDVEDGWKFIVARPARNVGNQVGGYSGTLTITGYTGVVNHGEYFVIKSENIRHVVDTFAPAAPTTTTSLTGAWGTLQADFAASSITVPVAFAQGNDKLYFSDGTGPIYAWDGSTLMNISTASTLDYSTGSTLHQTRTTPPQDVTILLWFQNRLIASGIPAEPDAIYFSDFFDGTSWDRDYQKVRIGGGESDPITGLLAWTDYNLLVFKKNSIYLVNCDPSQNSDPNDPTLLVASFGVKQLHKKIGCPAPRTAVQVGGGSTTPGSDVFFVDGDKKVHSIRRVVAAETQQEVGLAISLPIQDVLDTMRIDHIDRCCATYHNEHYILAIPTDSGLGGGTYPNLVVAYNLLTQSWCGTWFGWLPTCFSMRTDLGSYSKMIFGESNVWPGHCNVAQWMDDFSVEEETDTTYQDMVVAGVGYPIATVIFTRAFTFGDYYSYKTGLNVEFDFDQSVADDVTVKVFLDSVEQMFPGRGLLADPFDTFTSLRVRLPQVLNFDLPSTSELIRKAFDLQRYGVWRELQLYIYALAGKLSLRSIRITGFMDTVRLQTVPPDAVIPGLPPIPAGP